MALTHFVIMAYFIFQGSFVFKYAFIALFLTIPFLSSTPLFAIPLWVYGSLGATVVLAVVIVIAIEKEWETLK